MAKQDWTRLGRKKRLRVVGLMSGTSADGIDAAMVDIVGQTQKVRVGAFATYPYPPAVRREVRALCDPATSSVDRICHMNFLLGELFAEAVIRLADEAGICLDRIDLIGSHGQTIHHLPVPRRGLGRRIRSTLQIGEPSVIAERTGITTVADFRPRDVAAGGQGAPLVPYADHVLFASGRASRVICNIGGIANVTYLPAGAGIEKVLAFDTGPGNMVIDALVRHATGGRREFDRDGRLGRSGRVHQGLLAELLKHPYFRRRPPKTTGREQFGTAFARAMIERGRELALTEADLVATATALTARSIGRACGRLPGPVDEVILCGGGARNLAMVELLREAVGPAALRIMDELGIDADAKEAVSFAILAAATVRGQAGNVPSATGAGRAVVLGKIVPGR
ncbi:MAG TPA: anhydro-N-acetylmuramic acid kinase [Phycisphaerae bacterium]|nr:anhydro-N-acetylmuramic acid kinase [Phycisphaerae bacterium]